jgi:Polyketide cyclase / dehydrase and lipid transport
LDEFLRVIDNNSRIQNAESSMQATRFALVAAVALAVSTASAQALEVKRRTEVPGEPQTMWSFAGDFCAIKDWHPLVTDCQEIRQGDDTFRVVTLKDAAKSRRSSRRKAIPATAMRWLRARYP